MSLFQELFCKHEYESKTREMRHLNEDGSTHYPEIIIIQECKKCGKVKVTHIMPDDYKKLYGNSKTK